MGGDAVDALSRFSDAEGTFSKEVLMSQVSEIGDKMAELCRQGKNLEAIDKFYAPDIVSIEAMGSPEMPQEMHGIDAIRKKNQWWIDNMETAESSVSPAMVNGDRFMLHFNYDVREKKTGKRMKMEEVGLYTVKNGKVVKEEFFFHS